MNYGFESNAQLWMHWSVATFKKASSISSLNKAESEILELKESLIGKHSDKDKLLEYADVIMCVLHSAAKEGFRFEQIAEAFSLKSNINFYRTWELDESGNTYSHKK